MKNKKGILYFSSIFIFLLVTIFYLGAFIISNALLWIAQIGYNAAPNEVRANAFMGATYTLETISDYANGNYALGEENAAKTMEFSENTIRLVNQVQDKTQSEKNKFNFSIIQSAQMMMPLASLDIQLKYLPVFFNEVQLLADYYLTDGLNAYVFDEGQNPVCLYKNFVPYLMDIEDFNRLEIVYAQIVMLEHDNIVCNETSLITKDEYKDSTVIYQYSSGDKSNALNVYKFSNPDASMDDLDSFVQNYRFGFYDDMIDLKEKSKDIYNDKNRYFLNKYLLVPLRVWGSLFGL